MSWGARKAVSNLVGIATLMATGLALYFSDQKWANARWWHVLIIVVAAMCCERAIETAIEPWVEEGK